MEREIGSEGGARGEHGARRQHPNDLPPPFPTLPQILLFDRAFRDDARCAAKYGAYWDQYRKLVPYKVVPGVF